MTTIQAIILGILEGVTEFLPISSTGHLTLASHFLGIIQNEQFIVFEIAIQLGAILAVVFFFWKKFFNIELLTKLFIAFLPTGILGLFAYKYIKVLLSSEFIVAFSLILGGVILIVVEKMYSKKITSGLFTPSQTEISPEKISYKKSFILGLAQSIAMIPGVSRSGATIVAGLLMNIERKVLVEFTFLLAVPTMSAATLYAIYKNKDILSTDNFSNIFFGFVTSFIVALFVIKFLLNYIKKYDFIPFGIYRIFIGTIILLTLVS
jgi:undecaprenyl-diphosphatase